MAEKQSVISFKRKFGGQAGETLYRRKEIVKYQLTKNRVLLILLSLLLGRASILDGLAPFGIAFFIALFTKERRYGYLGIFVLMGIMTGDFSANIGKYGIALALSWGIFSYARNKIKYGTCYIASIGSIIMFLSGLLYLLITDLYIYDLFMIGFESIVVFVFIYILSYAVPIVVQKTNRKILSNEELICIAITAAVVVSGLSNLQMGSLSVKNIFGLLLTLVFAYNGGASVGAGVGVTIGIITSMSTIGTPTVIGIYSFSGLLAGVFKDIGKIGSAIGMILGNAILTFYINGSTEVIIKFQEIVAAFFIFMVIPKSLMVFMDKFVNNTGSSIQLDKAYSERIKKITNKRLREYANAFSELAKTYGSIAEKNKIIEQDDVADIVDSVVEKVCKDCGMCRSCWHNNFYHTYHSVVEVIGHLESNGKIKEEKIPEILKKRCIRMDSFIQNLSNMFDIYRIHYEWQRKLFESRQLVAEQFKGVSDIIERLATEVNMNVDFKTEVEDALYVAFDKEEFQVGKVTVLEKENGKLEIDIKKRSCFDRKQCDEKIGPIVSKVIGRDVIRKNNRCGIEAHEEHCSFTFVESQKYRIATGVARISKDGSICGDNYSFVDLNNGKYMCAISDGMGSGEKAAKESMTTITLLEQLMESGFDKEIAIKTINSILLLKSSEEIFSTMDLSLIDLYTGNMDFVKIGAASSFIKRVSGEVDVIKSTSLPIGILNKIDIESFGKRVNNGDYVIMMSDGVLDADKNMEEKEGWIISAIKEINSRNPQVIAEELLDRAIEKYGNKIEDDMTVLVSKIWEPR